MRSLLSPWPSFFAIRSAALAVLLLGALFGLSACQSEGPNLGVTVGNIESDPSQYFGQRVVVMEAPSPGNYAGRQMDLSSVEVREVLSDSTFWMGPTGESDASQRLFVFLNEHVTPETSTEGRYNIEQGQTISLQGSLRPLPDMEQVRQRLNLDEEAQSQLQNQAYYLWAQQASGVQAGQGGS